MKDVVRELEVGEVRVGFVLDKNTSVATFVPLCCHNVHCCTLLVVSVFTKLWTLGDDLSERACTRWESNTSVAAR